MSDGRGKSTVLRRLLERLVETALETLDVLDADAADLEDDDAEIYMVDDQ